MAWTSHDKVHTRPLGSQDGPENIETMMGDAVGNVVGRRLGETRNQPRDRAFIWPTRRLT
jgi:hypothetical protein